LALQEYRIAALPTISRLQELLAQSSDNGIMRL